MQTYVCAHTNLKVYTHVYAHECIHVIGYDVCTCINMYTPTCRYVIRIYIYIHLHIYMLI